MEAVARRPSLLQQNSLQLLIVFLVFEIVTAYSVMHFLMLPLARRAADDFAELLVVSARTWAELPPATRPAFERSLATDHGIELRLAPPPSAVAAGGHGPYVERLQASLSRQLPRTGALLDEERDGVGWHWAGVEAGGRQLWLGFPHSRVGTNPTATIVVTVIVGLVLALAAAWWLSRRIVAPLRRLDEAAAVLGRGEMPTRLPESGPRELAAVAGTVNALSQQVRDLLEARTTLLAGLSHDLRTPLTRMRLAVEMLGDDPQPALLQKLESDIEEMNRLVGDMLGLARGLGREGPAPVEVGALLRELADQAATSGAPIEVHADTGTVLAAPMALRRVVSNLLTNAQRYAGHEAIELRFERRTGEARIGVLDRGPGIPPDQLQAVFMPFHRVEASRSPQTGGAGLGLAIVRQLAQANRWTIDIENRAGGGLAAWLTVPG